MNKKQTYMAIHQETIKGKRKSQKQPERNDLLPSKKQNLSHRSFLRSTDRHQQTGEYYF